jgi:hypothetical protein
VRALPRGEFLHGRDRLLAALRDDVCGPEPLAQRRSPLVPAEEDDALRAQAPCREHTAKPDRAVAHHGRGGARPGARGQCRVVPGAHDV